MGLGLGASGPHGPVFAELLSDAQRERLLSVAHTRQVKKKKEVFQAGDETDGLYLIEDGLVQITLVSPNDKGTMVNQYGPGDIFGEMGVLDDLPRSANAIAMKDTTLHFIRSPVFLNLLLQEPQVALIVMQLLTQRLRHTSSALADALFKGLEPRLAKVLLDLAESQGVDTPKGRQISIVMSQYEIGQTIAFSRESTNKTLKKWQEKGLVTHQDGIVTIHDQERLSEIMESYD